MPDSGDQRLRAVWTTTYLADTLDAASAGECFEVGELLGQAMAALIGADLTVADAAVGRSDQLHRTLAGMSACTRAMAEQASAVEGCQSNACDVRRPPASLPPGRTVHPPAPRAPTARAMTRREVTNAAVAWTPIRIFARLVNGIVSVGLNALEFVVDRYR